MHFVTGGAFNGKSKWVKEYYQLVDTPYLWVSAYEGGLVPENLNEFGEGSLIVLEGIEIWLRDWIEQLDIQRAREKWQLLLLSWLEWERADRQRKIILIGTDITKGIVPIRAEDRKWRDITGWAYQDVVKSAERVDHIWYGISQQIK